MLKHCHHVADCKLCSFGSMVFGHGLTKLLGKKWQRITMDQVQPCTRGLNLIIVGGLEKRGYTEHDIDILGDEKDISVLVERLKAKKIYNLVHYCGVEKTRHSHLRALINGFLVTFLGNKVYFKNSLFKV